MKTACISSIVVGLLSFSQTSAQSSNFVNFIRQVQMPSGVQWDVSVGASGERLSPLEINPGGARFELHTVMNVDPFTPYLLDTRYVGAYVPIANVAIRTEDATSPILPRTRADRPFYVDITVSGLLLGASDPEASKSVRLLRHVQSYGVNGTGENLDRSQAILLSQVSLNQNGTHTLTYAINSVPGSDRAKVRGEERFSVFSIEDYQAPSSQLASQFVQIWPVADGNISGIENGAYLRFHVPKLTLTANDLYPGSAVYAQAYRGNSKLGMELGKDAALLPGSHENMPSSMVPQNRVFVLDNWDSVLEEDGRWTVELLSLTPFGIDRLDHITFDVNRTIQVNGSVTTIE